MKYCYAILAILALLGFVNTGLCKGKSEWPVAEMKGCMLEDLFYAKTNVDDPSLRETRSQLKAGGVTILAIPVFAEDKSPSGDVVKQSEIFRELPVAYPDDFSIVGTLDDLKNLKSNKVGLIGAIENAGALFSGAKQFEDGTKVFESIIANTKRILYVGLTWKYENVLGGGDTTKIGLKDYGNKLLEYLSERNKKSTYKIAVDISHASDALTKDIFDYINKHSLDLRVVASHSSVRSVKDIPRNIPDWVIEKIIKDDGVVGLNFINGYIGNNASDFLKHFEYVIKNLNGEKSIVFGADWFKTDREDISKVVKEVHAYFFDRYGDASSYQTLLRDLKKKYKLTNEQLTDIASMNFIRFVQRQWGE